MCPDIMHDLLEGTVQFEMRQLLNVLFEQKLISLDLLNERIQSFPFNGSDATDKPTLISTATLKQSDHSVKQKGEEYLYACHSLFSKQHQCSCSDVVPSKVVSSTYRKRNSRNMSRVAKLSPSLKNFGHSFCTCFDT